MKKAHIGSRPQDKAGKVGFIKFFAFQWYKGVQKGFLEGFLGKTGELARWVGFDREKGLGLGS